jgi:hypothetical protein
MLFLFFALLLGVLSAICFLINWRKEKAEKGGVDWSVGGGVFAFFSIVMIAVLIFFTAVSVYNQREDFEEVRKFVKLEVIYQNKADALTVQFATYLAQAYPKHERDVFKSMSPGQISLYLVKYPELQASKTIVALVEQIAKLQNDRYAQQVKKEESLKDIRFRPNNPFVIGWLIPAPPDDVK